MYSRKEKIVWPWEVTFNLASSLFELFPKMSDVTYHINIFFNQILHWSLGYLNLCMCAMLFTEHILALTVVNACVLCIQKNIQLEVCILQTAEMVKVACKMVIILNRTTSTNQVFILLSRWAGCWIEYHLLHNGAFIFKVQDLKKSHTIDL